MRDALLKQGDALLKQGTPCWGTLLTQQAWVPPFSSLRSVVLLILCRRSLTFITALVPNFDYCPVKSICLFSSLYLLVESGRLAECSAPRLTCAAVVRASGN